uniref:Adenosine 5'-monophosphoramidase HINT3 n=1 Tax=Arion vulgaris TaxID=1028688 RepID=A0A0B7BIR7_9EUPU
MAADAQSKVVPSKCLFCRIANNQEPNSRLLYEKDDIVIFRDIRPAAAHHYLVVPQNHVADPKHLGPEDLDLVNKLITVGEAFLVKEGGDVADSRLGFHWPPFNSVSHLHLHVIAPAKSMGLIASMIFKPNTLWFVTPDWLVNRLQNMKLSQ